MRPTSLLSLTERQAIEELLKWSLPAHKIAKRLNRSRQCISREIAKNTTDGPYNAEKAHNLSYVHRKEGAKKGFLKTALEQSKIFDRVSALEMQIEIILDQLKELHERNPKNK